jgi:hypothetical protein
MSVRAPAALAVALVPVGAVSVALGAPAGTKPAPQVLTRPRWWP